MVARDIWVIEEAFESHIFYCTVSVSGLARKSVDLQGRVRVPYRTFSHIQQTKKTRLKIYVLLVQIQPSPFYGDGSSRGRAIERNYCD